VIVERAGGGAGVLGELDPAAVRRWALACLDVLAAHREEIDAINVFPVPDADTGTNLLATMRAAVDELDRRAGAPLRLDGDGRDELGLAALADGALRGARGNSGLVLAQFLRGLAAAPERNASLVSERVDQTGVASTLTAAEVARGLRLGAELAAGAFEPAVAGTAVTVLAAAAAAASGDKLAAMVAATSGDKLAAVVDAAAAAAAAALAETPRQLPALARAGVVDAGGRGVQLLLEALAAVVNERPLAVPPVPRPVRDASALVATREAGSAKHEYEVMYLLDASTADRVAALRARLASIGDSVAVVGDGDTWNVHVHCTDVGAAIEAGIDAGRPYRITVIRFADRPSAPATPRAVIALAPDELAVLFRGEGAVVVPAHAPGDRLRAAIEGTGAAHVVVLPNSAEATALAEAAASGARGAGHDVVVVPTASPVQGLAALAVHDPARRAGDDVVAMAEAAAATRCGSLEIAGQEALTWAGRCRPGDVLGLVDGEVVLIGSDVTKAACALVERMLAAGGELVTALLGAAAPAELGDVLAQRLRREHPEVELAIHHGGQPEPLLVGVE
jgi:uncharacterized protein